MSAASTPRVPGTAWVHTADRAVPRLDHDPELAGLHDDLAGIHPGIDLIRSGLRLIATERLTRDETQTLIAVLGGSSDGTDIVALVGATIRRLADADHNPCLRDLHSDEQANLRRLGDAYVVDVATTAPRDLAAEMAGRIDPYADDVGQLDEDSAAEPVWTNDPSLIPGPSKIRESAVTGRPSGIVVRVDVLEWNATIARVRIEDGGIHLRQGHIHTVPITALIHVSDFDYDD